MVLNTHQPFVRHPEIEHSPEETWLNEAITESYIPLLETGEAWVRDGIDGKLTFSWSPCLLAMLTDPLRQQRYVRYMEERIKFLEWERERLSGEPALARLARMYHRRFIRCHELFVQIWHGQLVSALRRLEASGVISLITSAATHAYLPLWELYPEIVELQIRAAIRYHQDCFGKRPNGFWLPECGFFPGLDSLLCNNGIKFFFLDAHGILNGDPEPKYRQYAPVHTPCGAAVFARDWQSHEQVWLKDRGYPGDPVYMDQEGDIGFGLTPEDLLRLTHQQSPTPTGIRYYRGKGSSRQAYDPQVAFARCVEHASHFVKSCQQQAERLAALIGREPVIVAMFDTEHFGHWWYEGTIWLDFVVRKLACEQNVIKLITAEEYLRDQPTNQVVKPSMSSWGYQGYSETWLMGRNHWIYPAVYSAIDAFKQLAARNPTPEGVHRAALNQYLRELLLAQSSDWAYLMWAQMAQRYAESRVKVHLDNMDIIRRQFDNNCFDSEWLESVRKRNNLFATTDLLGFYKAILAGR
jgi:1,4-alpha-glucan branching enzyme